MPRNAALATLLLSCTTAAALTSTAGGASRTPEPCDRAGTTTELANRYIRVYRDHHDPPQIFACDRKSGTATKLAFGTSYGVDVWGGRNATAVRGHVLVYSLVEDAGSDADPPSTGTTIIRIVLPSTGYAPDSLNAGRQPLTSLNPTIPIPHPAIAAERTLIAPNGTVLVAVCPGDADDLSAGCTRPFKAPVRLIAFPTTTFNRPGHPRTTEPVTLASATNISPRSLRLSPSGTRVAWTQGGRRHIARVP
jgi:hypothetical protein